MLEFFASIVSAIVSLVTSRRRDIILKSLDDTLKELSDNLVRNVPPDKVLNARLDLNNNAHNIYEVVTATDERVDDRRRSDGPYVRDVTWQTFVERFGPRLGRIVYEDGNFRRV